ncbi:MAG TPA: tRNA pseudouridine(38-40) synthase TruA [Rhodospirillaceae bacterium]|nr:tRNA pseudouridine(38-40) synthase TruA [Rhodospirillaceae bacterium]
MTRYKLTVEYDGTDYVGWQRQENGPSIQAELEAAILSFSNETAIVYGAGRTDAGVHAAAMPAHVEIEKDFDADTVRDAMNHFLRDVPIAVLAAEIVTDDFHARYAATARHYRYRILNRRPQPALDAGRVWWIRSWLDVDAMAAAAQELIGHHDFTSFRATLCQAKSPRKTLDRLEVSRQGKEVIVDASAQSFLHHQVRNIVGTLVMVGEGKWTRADVRAALEARARAAAGPTAPARGLYLIRVDY